MDASLDTKTDETGLSFTPGQSPPTIYTPSSGTVHSLSEERVGNV